MTSNWKIRFYDEVEGTCFIIFRDNFLYFYSNMYAGIDGKEQARNEASKLLERYQEEDKINEREFPPIQCPR